MATRTASAESPQIVLVVGVDLSDVSAPLLTTARDLVRSSPEAEIHVVHVVTPESLALRLTEPLGCPIGIVDRAHIESAQFELQRLCDDILRVANVRAVVHTPVGSAAQELAGVARAVGAHIIVLHAHDGSSRRRALRRSVIDGVAQWAPCSVLAIRAHAAAVASRGSAAAA
jgi:nucleotide-binding universal stress UspA family protein